MARRFLLALAGLVASTGVAGQPDFPRVRVAGPAPITVQPHNELLTIHASISQVRFAADETRIAADAGTELELNLFANNRAGVYAGGLGDDLVVRGSLDRDGDGTADYQGVLLRGEWFAYTAHDAGSRRLRTTGSKLPPLVERELRFSVEGGALADMFAGKDITLLLRQDSSGSFGIGGGTLGAARTVLGACCLFPTDCAQLTQIECDNLGGGFQGEGTACVEPESAVAIGRHRLVGRNFQGIADVGLVLDALDGDPDSTFVYRFSGPGAEVFLDYDGSVARISGTAVGGPLTSGLQGDDETVRFEFAYTQVGLSGGDLVGPGSALGFGFLVRIEADEVVVLENGSNGLTVTSGGALDGDLTYFLSDRGTKRLFQAQLDSAVPTCASPMGACCGFDGSCSQTSADVCDTLSGTFDPAGDCADDADADGVSDSCDICPGGDDNLDTDGDGIPNYCDTDPGVSNGGCCFDFGCIILNAEECDWNGGVYQGDGTSCFQCN